MQPGQFLKDIRHQEERFRIKELLAQGKHYQIAIAEDTRLEDKLVCVKTIEYDAKHASDANYIKGRRQALKDELHFLTLATHLLPEPFDWIEVGQSAVGQAPEPLLIYEYQHGQTLFELVRTRHPQGMNPRRALRIFSELVGFAGDLHAQGYIFRDFDPRHIIVGFDDIIHVVGCGNAVKRGEKMNVYKMNTNPCYTAPEIRRELSGKVVRPACDFYSLGCLLVFMLTGNETRPQVESPLDADSYDRLKSGEFPAGYRLLIARCLQPLAQKRFATASKLQPYCFPQSLPHAQSDGFGLLDLPVPWSGPEGAQSAAARSNISRGPLISQKTEQETRPAQAPTQPAQPSQPAQPAQPAASNEQAMVKKPETAVEKPASNKKLVFALGAVFLMIIMGILVIGAAVGVGVLSMN